jgi:Zn finger protein HypA/HybF involved in hydrogenase expression
VHEGAVCREIMDIVEAAARANAIKKVYEIIVSTGPYSCLNENQLNFYFSVARENTCMADAVIRLEPDGSLQGASQMYVKTFRGE